MASKRWSPVRSRGCPAWQPSMTMVTWTPFVGPHRCKHSWKTRLQTWKSLEISIFQSQTLEVYVACRFRGWYGVIMMVLSKGKTHLQGEQIRQNLGSWICLDIPKRIQKGSPNHREGWAIRFQESKLERHQDSRFSDCGKNLTQILPREGKNKSYLTYPMILRILVLFGSQSKKLSSLALFIASPNRSVRLFIWSVVEAPDGKVASAWCTS